MPRDDSGPTSPIPRKFLDTTDQKLAVIISDLKRMGPKVDDTNEKVVELKTEFKGMNDRVTKVETKIDEGHKCLIPDVINDLKSNQKESSQKIDTDVQKGIEQRVKLESLAKEAASIEADVEDIKKAPRRMFYALIGVVLTVLTGVGSGIWFFAKLDTQMEYEQKQRAEQIKMIKAEINSVGDIADPTPIKAEVSELREVVQTSNGHEEEYNNLCEGAQPYVRRFLREDLIKRGKRVPVSCLDIQE